MMAFTRKFLSSLGIEEDKVDTIIDAHAEVVDALKDEINKYKADAEKLPEVQQKLDEIKSAANDGYEEKYNTLQQEFDAYKADIAEKESTERKAEAYRALLKEVGISDKRLDTVIKVDGEVIKGITIDDKGVVKDADALKAKAKESWGDFIVTEDTHGSAAANPPASDGKVYKTKDEIMAIKDTDERQKAIADNHELFGF